VTRSLTAKGGVFASFRISSSAASISISPVAMFLLIGVGVALGDLALDGDDGLAAQLGGLVVDLLHAVGAEEDLRLAVAVA
jgi:hypothetical protein